MPIDLYVSPRAFIFRKGAKDAGIAPFDTLKLAPAKGVSADEISEMEYQIEEYVPGEKYKTKAFGEIVLGPAREFTHEVTLHACGNPDFRQFTSIGPKKTVMVCGIEEAVAAVKAYQSRYDMGGGNCAKEHGVVWELPKNGKGKRKRVGEVSYNGRYWTVAEKAAWEAEIKAKYATPA